MHQLKEKIVVDVADNQLLEELNVPDMIRQFHRLHTRQKLAEKIAARHELRKKGIGASLQVAISAVKADTVTYSGKYNWRATVVKSEPSTALDENLLRDNLMRKCGMDAEQVEEFLKLSSKPVPAKASFVRVTAGE